MHTVYLLYSLLYLPVLLFLLLQVSNDFLCCDWFLTQACEFWFFLHSRFKKPCLGLLLEPLPKPLKYYLLGTRRLLSDLIVTATSSVASKLASHSFPNCDP